LLDGIMERNKENDSETGTKDQPKK